MQLFSGCGASVLFRLTSYELKTVRRTASATPLEIGVPVLRLGVLDNGAVVVLVAIFTVLSKAAEVADSNVFEFAIFGGGGAKAVEVASGRVFGIGVFGELCSGPFESRRCEDFRLAAFETLAFPFATFFATFFFGAAAFFLTAFFFTAFFLLDFFATFVLATAFFFGLVFFELAFLLDARFLATAFFFVVCFFAIISQVLKVSRGEHRYELSSWLLTCC